VIVAAAIAGLAVSAAVWIWLSARLVRLGILDALALAEKTAVPDPESALDWPDMCLRAVLAEPDDESLVILHVIWPAHPARESTLLMALDPDDQRSIALLSRWCAGHASVCPMREPGTGLELRRRQSRERVYARLLAEDFTRAA
jgi:hypothetical protein